MPFKIKNTGKKLLVVTEDTGKVHGTFSNTDAGRSKAEAQLRALYAEVPEARKPARNRG